MTNFSDRVSWNTNCGSKGVELLCQVIYETVKRDPEYTFEIVGTQVEAWSKRYFEEFIKRNGLENNVKRIQRVEDVNEWMEGIDYILSTSMKECQSLPLLEAMAKGVKPVIHHWWDASELYPEKFIFQTPKQAVDIIMNDDYNSNEYYKFVAVNYDINIQVNKLNKILNLWKRF